MNWIYNENLIYLYFAKTVCDTEAKFFEHKEATKLWLPRSLSIYQMETMCWIYSFLAIFRIHAMILPLSQRRRKKRTNHVYAVRIHFTMFIFCSVLIIAMAHPLLFLYARRYMDDCNKIWIWECLRIHSHSTKAEREGKIQNHSHTHTYTVIQSLTMKYIHCAVDRQ